MGHYRSEMMGKEESDEQMRFAEMLEIRKKMQNVPLSSLTFGQLTFLNNIFTCGHSWNITKEDLKELRKIYKATK